MGGRALGSKALIELSIPHIFLSRLNTAHVTIPVPLLLADVWIQLYVGDQEIELAMRFLCEHDSIVTDLTNLVKEKRSVLLHHCDGAELSVYPPGTRLDALNNVSCLDPHGPVLHSTTKEHPLIVRAPSAVTQHGKCL
jgi:hypothetical protein